MTMKLFPTLLTAALVAIAACDKPKVRALPPTPDATAQAPGAALAAAGAPLSEGLARRPEFPGFYLDRVGTAADPLNRQPAVVNGAEPMQISGFGFDAATKTPAKGVDVVIDGKAYGTAYGHGRQDVADFHKVPALVPVGFTLTLPPQTLAAGEHTAVVRVVAADGKSYYEAPPVRFQVQ